MTVVVAAGLSFSAALSSPADSSPTDPSPPDRPTARPLAARPLARPQHQIEAAQVGAVHAEPCRGGLGRHNTASAGAGAGV
ncbi:hypothetical protein ACFWDI_35110 [Streptomyces sp. NPDC060064]|uniref:hypothetical protein n=1 Tax=Streptomyces sp. NPDC060064 TaxID=3347049 RepID=UPI0036C118B5